MTTTPIDDGLMRQVAPTPTILRELVDGLRYRQPGWSFSLYDVDRGQGSVGLTLEITITCDDAYHEGRARSVVHYMPVPPAAYDMRSWRRWLLEQIRLVLTHEACENFEIDGVKPYAPSHGPGNDPYLIREIGTVEDVETSFRGDRK